MTKCTAELFRGISHGETIRRAEQTKADPDKRDSRESLILDYGARGCDNR